MDVFCVRSTPMLWKYSCFQKTISPGKKNKLFTGFVEHSWMLTAGFPKAPLQLCRAPPADDAVWLWVPPAESGDAVIHPPCPLLAQTERKQKAPLKTTPVKIQKGEEQRSKPSKRMLELGAHR